MGSEKSENLKEIRIKSCPICHSECVVDLGGDMASGSVGYMIHCTNDNCPCSKIVKIYKNLNEAVTAWNKRDKNDNSKYVVYKVDTKELNEEIEEIANSLYGVINDSKNSKNSKDNKDNTVQDNKPVKNDKNNQIDSIKNSKDRIRETVDRLSEEFSKIDKKGLKKADSQLSDIVGEELVNRIKSSVIKERNKNKNDYDEYDIDAEYDFYVDMNEISEIKDIIHTDHEILGSIMSAISCLMYELENTVFKSKTYMDKDEKENNTENTVDDNSVTDNVDNVDNGRTLYLNTGNNDIHIIDEDENNSNIKTTNDSKIYDFEGDYSVEYIENLYGSYILFDTEKLKYVCVDRVHDTNYIDAYVKAVGILGKEKVNSGRYKLVFYVG